MGPIANSLILRIAGVLLVIGVLFNIVMALALYAPIGRERGALHLLPLPRQAASIVDVIETAPIEKRAAFLEAVNTQALQVRIIEDLPQPSARTVASGTVERLLTRYDATFADRDIHVEVRRRRLLERVFGAQGRAHWEPSQLYVRIDTGEWVMLAPARGARLDTMLTRGVALVSLGGVFVIVALWLAVRQTTRPVEQLAASARDFAERLDAPAIPEAGPKELRELAGAFNQMKTRIRALVNDRTRVLAAVAHDLRTYLTRLKLRTEFIGDADQRARAERDLDEMADLIDDTLFFARQDHGYETGSADVDVELATLVDVWRERGQDLRVDAGAPAGARVALSPVGLRRVLSNLVDNAMRYGRSPLVATAMQGDRVSVTVEDDGPGIPEDSLERVTAAFERLEPSRGRGSGGAGLGLAIVKSIVEGAGGSLLLSNRPTGGLRVELRLPIEAQQ